MKKRPGILDEEQIRKCYRQGWKKIKVKSELPSDGLKGRLNRENLEILVHLHATVSHEDFQLTILQQFARLVHPRMNNGDIEMIAERTYNERPRVFQYIIKKYGLRHRNT